MQIKSKTVMSWRKNKDILIPFILSEGNFFNICALSQCKMYWIHFQDIYTYFLKLANTFSLSLSLLFRQLIGQFCQFSLHWFLVGSGGFMFFQLFIHENYNGYLLDNFHKTWFTWYIFVCDVSSLNSVYIFSPFIR